MILLRIRLTGITLGSAGVTYVLANGKPSPEDKKPVRDQHKLLEATPAAGDKRAEIVLSLIAVADEALKMRESLAKILEIYENRFNEILEDASLYFPVDLAVKPGNCTSIEKISRMLRRRFTYLQLRQRSLLTFQKQR